MKKSLIVLFLVGLLILPVISLGQSIPSTPTGSQSLGAILGVVMGLIWEIAFALAVIMFIAAGIMFSTSGGAPEKVSTARSTAMWAVAGVVVAVIAFSLDTILGTIT